MSDLPPFPVDDVTLSALEQALTVGGDYTLTDLLKFLSGAPGRDPNAEVLEPGRDDADLPSWERGRWEDARVVFNTRTTYSPKNVTCALMAEVRRLRALVPDDQKDPQP